MGKKHKNLYDLVCENSRLQAAYLRAQEGKRSSNGFLVFQEFAQANLFEIQRKLIDESWEPEPYRRFVIYEPKMRKIGAPSFSDRVVHHSLCSVIEPIMDKTFLPWTFACRFGKGTHAGVAYVQSMLRKNCYTHFLKTDFRSFFPSINTDILHSRYEKKISCKRTLNLLKKIIPPGERGVPIGALTSQLSANVYGNILDQYIHHELKVPFARYMDDVIVLGHDPGYLREIKNKIEFFSFHEMGMSLSKWQVQSTSRGVNFLGYRIWATHKLLRKSSVTAAKRKIKRFISKSETEELVRFLGSWRGHAGKADTQNLLAWLDREYNYVKLENNQKSKPRASRESLLESMFRVGV